MNKLSEQTRYRVTMRDEGQKLEREFVGTYMGIDYGGGLLFSLRPSAGTVAILTSSVRGEPEPTTDPHHTPRLKVNPRDLIVTYGVKPQKGYVLQDRKSHRVVFESDQKSDVIAEAQRRKGLSPVDGDEGTYAGQVDLFRAPTNLVIKT